MAGIILLFSVTDDISCSLFMPKDPAWHGTSYVSVPFLSDKEVAKLITFITMGSISCSGKEESWQMKKLKVYKLFMLIPA